MADTERLPLYTPGSITWEEYNEGGRNEQIYELNFIVQKVAEKYGLYFRTVAALHLVDNIPIDHLNPLLSSFENLRRYKKKNESTEEIIYQDQVSLQAVTEVYRFLDGDIVKLRTTTSRVKKQAENTELRKGLYNDLLAKVVLVNNVITDSTPGVEIG